MALLVADSLNFDSDEINEIFTFKKPTGDATYSLPNGKFYINAEYMPNLGEVRYVDGEKIKADFDLEKVETKNI